MRIRLLLALGALSLGGCTDFALRDLREAQFSGTAFQQALAVQYRALSEEEATNYDWADSQAYAEMGLRSAYGTAVVPTAPSARRIPQAQRPELEDAHARLLAARDSRVTEEAPEMLARAQGQYECWLENQEDHWQQDRIDTCRENFESAMRALDRPTAATGFKEEPAPAKTAAPVAKPKAAARQQARQDFYVLFFRLGSARLEAGGLAKLQEIAADLRRSGEAYRIMLNGHTDRVGADAMNLKLSEARAQSVKAAMAKMGLNAKHIAVFAFGETDPKVPTEDGVAEPKNRRVEILLN